MGQERRVGAVLGASAVMALLVGCAAGTPPTPSPTVTVTAVASSAAPSSAAPTAVTTSTPSSTASAVAGCAPNGVAIPPGADTAQVGDVDDGDADATEFSAESVPFEFGVHTASGATIVTKDDLAGPGVHSGWIARLASGTVAVLDDGRNATLHALVGCRFITTTDRSGKPYGFTLNGFGSFGTGVACVQDADGSRELAGLNAVKVTGGRYRIDRTIVQVSADGRIATNGAKTTGTTTYAANSAEVRAANTSTCGDVPKVHTSGE